jgi:hypothetical protein
LINYSQESNAHTDDDDYYYSNNNGGDAGGTKMLYTITRPVFQNAKLSLPLSSFIANCARARFFISAKSIHLINQSLKGYIQFSEGWKENSRSLDFFPLEQIDIYDYYLPEEIEEEIIISSASPSSPYYDNRRVVQRRIISGSPQAQQEKETSRIVTPPPPRSVDKDILKANYKNDDNSVNYDERHHAPPPPPPRQQSEMSPYQEAGYKSPSQKSVKKTIEEPRKEHGSDGDSSPSGENKAKSQLLRVTEPKTYYEKVFTGSFSSNEKAAEDHSRLKSPDRPRLSSVMPSLPLKRTQLVKAENLNQSVSRSVKQDRSSETLDSPQDKHIDKTADRSQIDKETIHDRKYSGDDFQMAVHQRGIVRQPDDRGPPPSSIAESLNLLKHPEVSSHDHPQLEGTRNKLPEPVDLTAEVAAENNNNNNISYINYDKNSSSIPNIKVNQLEIRVVGNRRTPTYLPNGPMEIAESTNKIGHYENDEEYATTTTSIKSLNKSYLWKYKVRL